MYEIKFRTYDVLNRKMVSPDFLKLPWLQRRDGLHLMEYIGLKDINGKEIYEGDIVKCDQSYRKWCGLRKVEWYEPKLRWYPTHMTDPKCNVEVIGNIFENPGLANGI